MKIRILKESKRIDEARQDIDFVNKLANQIMLGFVKRYPKLLKIWKEDPSSTASTQSFDVKVIDFKQQNKIYKITVGVYMGRQLQQLFLKKPDLFTKRIFKNAKGIIAGQRSLTFSNIRLSFIGRDPRRGRYNGGVALTFIASSDAKNTSR